MWVIQKKDYFNLYIISLSLSCHFKEIKPCRLLIYNKIKVLKDT